MHHNKRVRFNTPKPARLAIATSLLASSAAFAQMDTLPEVAVVSARESYAVTDSKAATRTDTPVDHVPQSIVVIPHGMIEDQGSRTLSDALKNVSDVNQVDSRDANNTVFKIRGFHTSTVIDGVAMPGYYSNQESLANVERIDVIKGPAGALYGSNQGMGSSNGNLGGTIAITTSEPEQAATRQVGIGLGSFSSKSANLDLNQPLNPQLAFRLSGEVARSGSESNGMFFRKTALFPSFSWTPNADTRIVVRLRNVENTTLDYSGLPTNGTLNTSVYTLPRSTSITSLGQPDTTHLSQGINLQWTQQLSDAWSFHLLTAQNGVTLDQRGVWLVDSAGMMGCMGFGNATPTTNLMCGARMWERFSTTTVSPSLTGEFQSANARHTVNLGWDYEKTRDDSFMIYSNVMGPVSMANVSLLNPVYPAWSEPRAPRTPDQQNRYSANVAYLQDQVDFGNWHLLGSLRHSEIRVTDVNPAWKFNNVTSNTRTTPRLGAVYEWTANVSTFVGYSAGIKVPTLAKFSAPPKPEEYQQKEIGLRLNNLNGITATLAYFDLTRNNVAVGDPAKPGFSIQTGRQQSKGFDVDLRWQMTPSVAWLAALSSQTARIVADTRASMVNKQLFNVPETTARIAARYDIHGGDLAGAGFGLGATYHSRLPGNSTNIFFTPAATVWDAQASYTSRSARYGLAVSNLFNRQYFVPSAYFGGGQVTPAQPRSLMLSAEFMF